MDMELKNNSVITIHKGRGLLVTKDKKRKTGGSSFAYGFGVCQRTKDNYILHNMLRVMSSNNPVCIPKSRPYMSHFEIISKTIFDDVIKLGGIPNKSLVAILPNIPKKYFSDFVRGLFDGDGCVYKNKKKGHITSYICSSSILFLKQLQKSMTKLGFRTSILSNGNKPRPCMELVFGVTQTTKLGEFMYNDIEGQLKLERKFEIFRADVLRRKLIKKAKN